MPEKIFNLKLDLNGQVVAPKIQIRRNDYDTNVFSAQILQNGVPVDITGWTPIFECLTPARKFIRDDGSEFSNMEIVDAANGKIEYTLSDKVFASLGNVDVAYFAFEKIENGSTKRFTTNNFYFTVINDVMTGNIEAGEYLSDVQTLISDINQLKEEYQTLNPSNYATLTKLAEETSRIDAQLAQIGDYTTVKSEGNSLSEKVQNEFNSRGYNVLWNASLALNGDWAPAIQASIDYLASKGGGTVFIPEGTFYIKSKIILKENVTLAGMSYNSIIKLADNTEIDYMLETQLIEDRYLYNINIHDLCFDGNRLKGAKSNGIMIYNTWQGNFERLKLIDIGGTAFTLYGKGHGASTNWLKNSIITYNDGYGVLVDAEKDGDGNLLALNGDFHIDGCDIGMNGLAGVVFVPSACTIKNSVVWMNGQKMINNNACGILTKKTADLAEIKNCQIEGNKQNGLEIHGSHNNIVGNRIFANSQQQDWAYHGIVIKPDAKGTNIKDNKILSGIGVAGQQRSIFNGGTYTDIKDNDLVFMHYGDFKLDIDPVEYTDIAFTTMNFDYNHIITDIEYTLGQTFTTTAGTTEVLKFNARVRDSFLEYNTINGTFKPRFTGYYVFTFNLFLIPTTETDVQVFVDGKTLFKEYINKGRVVTITTPPIYITKDQTRDISIYTSSSLTVDPISTLRIYKA